MKQTIKNPLAPLQVEPNGIYHMPRNRDRNWNAQNLGTGQNPDTPSRGGLDLPPPVKSRMATTTAGAPERKGKTPQPSGHP